ncbi:hypothetical protein [Xanthomonas hortorum]|nr:hypothetical protein [Xanthomonas hortorum]MCE4356713.1 hypothetical protein [Xanthomonas hortorum pv. taraxaci]
MPGILAERGSAAEDSAPIAPIGGIFMRRLRSPPIHCAATNVAPLIYR